MLLQIDQIETVDWNLLIASPTVMSVFFYYVVKHHDPNASD